MALPSLVLTSVALTFMVLTSKLLSQCVSGQMWTLHPRAGYVPPTFRLRSWNPWFWRLGILGFDYHGFDILGFDLHGFAFHGFDLVERRNTS